MKINILTYLAATMLLCSCGGSNDSSASSTTTKVNDNEIEVLAQNAAQVIASCDRTDTFAIQRAIIDARAQRSSLVINGNDEGAKVYDEALKAALHKLNPQLCDTIFDKSK